MQFKNNNNPCHTSMERKLTVWLPFMCYLFLYPSCRSQNQTDGASKVIAHARENESDKLEVKASN
jgi:hypothetical protein